MILSQLNNALIFELSFLLSRKALIPSIPLAPFSNLMNSIFSAISPSERLSQESLINFFVEIIASIGFKDILSASWSAFLLIHQFRRCD